jgi:nuclear cap-binding protein subunit 2
MDSRGSQNKRRRFDKDQRDGDDDTNMQNDQPEEDPLKNATTLYVGNL